MDALENAPLRTMRCVIMNGINLAQVYTKSRADQLLNTSHLSEQK